MGLTTGEEVMMVLRSEMQELSEEHNRSVVFQGFARQHRRHGRLVVVRLPSGQLIDAFRHELVDPRTNEPVRIVEEWS